MYMCVYINRERETIPKINLTPTTSNIKKKTTTTEALVESHVPTGRCSAPHQWRSTPGAPQRRSSPWKGET